MRDESLACGTCRLLALTLSIVLIVGCGGEGSRGQVVEEPKFTVEGTLDFMRPDSSVIVRIAVELAETREEQMMGLMRRRSLPSKGGMLFVYPAEQDQSFWMKNTPLPLDIIFIAADSSVVNIVRRTRPLSEQRIESDGPAQFVLEVRAGFTERFGIDESTTVSWQRT